MSYFFLVTANVSHFDLIVDGLPDADFVLQAVFHIDMDYHLTDETSTTETINGNNETEDVSKLDILYQGYYVVSVCLSICLFVCPSTCPSVHP